MEEVLRSSEEKFRKLVENLQDNYFFYSHNTDGIFTYVSPSISNILGYSTKEFLTHYSEYLTDNPINNEVVRHTELSIKGIKQPPYELEIYHKKGFVRILKVQEAPVLDKDCKVIAVEGIAEDITERKRVEEKLLSYQQQLKSLASSLSLAEERERRHIAEKLHDRIGQSLIVVKMKLEALRESEYSNGLNHILDDSYELLEKTIQDIRTLTFELSPPVLYELGFEPALEWLAEQFQKHHDIVIDFANDGKSKPLDDDMRALLYRSVRELFFNIVKHANAHNVIVSIRKKENKIQIDVKDDGVGFNPHDVSHSVTKTGGFGLFHVRERLEHFGGHLWIRSKPGLETQITLVAPLKCEGEKLIRGK
jgi:PAS domain S-box-containing protein